jgi:iron complex transport system ATP-binding protein
MKSDAGCPALKTRGLAIGWIGRTERILASGIDLELRGGELAVLVGPNGSGKSTLLRTLTGLQPPVGGEAYLCGSAVGRLSVEERARKAACVFTDRYEAGYFTVFDIVSFGRYPYTDTRNILGAEDIDAVEGALAAVGLSALAQRRFSELSDGERQKTLIARAIAQDCPLLVFDEPTAFLDAPARVEVFHVVRRLARASRKAIVLSTHDIDNALGFADRLWLMDGHHRFIAGAPEDLVLDGSIGRAFDGDGFRFDPKTGAFRSAPEAKPRAVEILGAQGAAHVWTRRLVERLGLTEAGPGGEAIARITIEESEAGPLFSVSAKNPETPDGGELELSAASFDELARILSEFRNA